jgi:hypothetical protein
VTSEELAPAPDDEQIHLDTIRALTRALELALPHLPSDVLRDVSAALVSEVRFTPEGRSLAERQPSSVEEELGAAWSSLEPPTK